jgi:hypothetical protein
MSHKDPVKDAANKRAYYLSHKEQFRQSRKRWNDANREKRAACARKYVQQLKLAALAAYGPNGEVKCSWPGCTVTDPDMLSLDHLNDDGCRHRRLTGQRGGYAFCALLKKSGYPPICQTLCHNHQWKKEIMRRRAL